MAGKIPILIDSDGVLKSGEKIFDGIKDFFSFLEQNEIPSIIVSNSTLKSSTEIRDFFTERNIEIPFKIMTAADAALEYVKSNYRSCIAYCSEPVRSMFSSLYKSYKPEAVVIGDMGQTWNYEIMNDIFQKVFNGADIIAMQKNRYWNTPEDGFLLDVGPFVKAIEYAADKDAVLIGKPSPKYFESALGLIDCPSDSKFIMLGDDLETDILPAQKSGGCGILIYTGKTSYPLPAESKIKPDYEVMNLNEAITVIEKLYFGKTNGN